MSKLVFFSAVIFLITETLPLKMSSKKSKNLVEEAQKVEEEEEDDYMSATFVDESLK